MDIEDFVQKEIAGPGLNFHNNSVSSNQRQSFERVKHTSANLVRDNRRINTQESLRALRLNTKPLSHVVGAQDDWLRVNFSLFKVIHTILNPANLYSITIGQNKAIFNKVI